MSDPFDRPAGVSEAGALTAALDGVLRAGLARVSPAQREALGELAASCSATPLGPVASAAVTALSSSRFEPHHLLALTACREALEGARAEALARAAAAGLDLVLREPEETPPEPYPEEARDPLAALSQWLMEVALAGFEHVEDDTLASVVTLLPRLQAEPALARVATLTTLWVDELLAHDRSSDPPERRWGDLFSRALLATVAPPPVVTQREVTGSLRVFGAELFHGPHAYQLVVHGVLHVDGERQLVRVPLSRWKVDALTGAEVLHDLYARAPELLDAVATPVELTVRGGRLCSSGELLLTGSVESVEVREDGPITPEEIELAGATCSLPAARDRHPVTLALPYRARAPLAEGLPPGVRLNLDRVSPWLRCEDKAMAKATSAFGLVRFDDGWEFTPLNAAAKKRWITPKKAIAAGAKLKAPAAAILQERASRLLRA